MWQVTSDVTKAAGRGRTSRHPSPVTRPSRSGIALVITLILLSVTLVMAVAFLAVARRERNAVTTTTDTTTARLAAESALAAAQAQIIANIFATTNAAAYDYHLLVSTNYINGQGFTTGAANPTNVNYFYPNGNFLAGNDLIQNIANLYLLPRPPVFVPLNGGTASDFRFFLDLNENGRFETNGWVPEFDSAGIATGNNVLATGDPEWVGLLERPDTLHSPNNKFVARYAFLAQPIGNSLDVNYIHNQVKNGPLNPAMPVGNDGYFRNQGVGSWEMNLAAFLADLNTNQWNPPTALNAANNPYTFQQPLNPNRGAAFEDALSLLSYRYNFTYNSLAAANQLFPNAANVFPYDRLDSYSDGPLQITLNTNADFPFPDISSQPWAGADNPNHFFTPSDFYATANNLGAFPTHLRNAGTYTAANGVAPTYDRYTFYRMLDQLGTDSTADSGKLNLNYRNVTNGVVVAGLETNLYSWTALEFFNNAADRLLRLYTTNWFASNPTNYLVTYYGFTPNNYVSPDGYGLTNFPYFGLTNQVPAFGLGNIPVQVNGSFVYAPAVNRLLQLAANLYDASTNSFYPSVFRPMFSRDIYSNLYITGYTNVVSVSGWNDLQLSTPFNSTEVLLPNGSNVLVNVYGVPWIIGAKKGFPNFNKLGMQNVITINRKLQIKRNKIPSLLPADYDITNQLYAFGISNTIGIECWNSYTNTYPNPVEINVRNALSMWITNDYGAPPTYFTNNVTFTTNSVYPWPGNGYVIPIQSTAILLGNYDFYFGPGVLPGFYSPAANYGWESNRGSFYLPQFGLLTTNRVQLSMLDYSNNVYHVIDYVQLAGPESSRNLNAAFQTRLTANTTYDNMWGTNVDANGLPYGIKSQLAISMGQKPYNATYWKNIQLVPGASSPQDEIAGFSSFLQGGNNGVYSSNYVVQVPYTPTATIYDYTSWQANDPLVHYLASDLVNNAAENSGNLLPGIHKLADNIASPPTPQYTVVNERYQPWGINAQMKGLPQVGPNAVVADAYNLACKDPLVQSSDYWDFPTNQYPTVGWIGRVHRGTPWQTVFLKAKDVLHYFGTTGDARSGTNTWTVWTGNYNTFDAANMVPTQDRMLFDLFTTRFNDNAVRGTLSVNQNNLAAWSAVFSGMVALSNSVADSVASYSPAATTNLIIDPAGLAGTNSPLGQIVSGINNARQYYTNADGLAGAFEHVGDLLATPALTEQSPFLNRTAVQQQYGISDELYEWLPQQMLGLLRNATEPRYVVYCYGQALRPAAGSMVTSGGQFFGLITNYQVVAETAARAVLRVNKQVTATGTNYSTVVESYNVLPPN